MIKSIDVINVFSQIPYQIEYSYRFKSSDEAIESYYNDLNKLYKLIKSSEFNSLSKISEFKFFVKKPKPKTLLKETEQLTLLNFDKNESSFVEQIQNENMDKSISKILQFSLDLLSQIKDSKMIESILEIFEESFKTLPQLIMWRTTGTYSNTIRELKTFLYNVLNDESYECKETKSKCLEILVMLLGKMGGFTNIIEFLAATITNSTIKSFEEHLMLSYDRINGFLQSLIIGSWHLSTELKFHIEDVLASTVDTENPELISLEQLMNILLAMLERAVQVEYCMETSKASITNVVRGDFTKPSKPNEDIAIWDLGKEIENIKPAYPDSTSTRSSNYMERCSVKQVIMSSKEIIMLNNHGQLRYKNINNSTGPVTSSIKDIFTHNWYPIQFPDINVKITKLVISPTTDDTKEHILAVDYHGQLYSWGDGSFGKLGHGDTKSLVQPRLVETFVGYNIREISCNCYHSAVTTETGICFAWGLTHCFYKHCADCNKCQIFQSVPQKLDIELCSKVICGFNYTVVLSAEESHLYLIDANAQSIITTDSSEYIFKSTNKYPYHIDFHINSAVTINMNASSPFVFTKVVCNSHGIVAMCNKAKLWSIGSPKIASDNINFNLIGFGLPNQDAIDFDLSESHITILYDNGVTYSWSIIQEPFVLFKSQLINNPSVNSISNCYLSIVNRQVSIGWTRMTNKQDRTKYRHNPFLKVTNWSYTLRLFTRIVHKYCKDDELHKLTKIVSLLNIIVRNHNILSEGQFTIDFDDSLELIKIILELYKPQDISEDLSKLLLSLLTNLCCLCYRNSSNICKFICKLFIKDGLHTTKTIQEHIPIEESVVLRIDTIDRGRLCLIHTLINNCVHTDKQIGDVLNQLAHSDVDQLNDLVVILIRSAADCVMQSLHNWSSISTGAYNNNNSLSQLHMGFIDCYCEFVVLAYRYLVMAISRNSSTDGFSMTGHLCQLLPIINSVLSSFKSFIQQLNKDDFHSWLSASYSSSSNSNAPIIQTVQIQHKLMQCLLSDVFGSALAYTGLQLGLLKPDLLSIIPHLSSSLLCLDSINRLLPCTAVFDLQHMYWSIHGFTAQPHENLSIIEKKWVWLLNLEKSLGYNLGKYFQYVIARMQVVSESSVPSLNINLSTKLGHILRDLVNSEYIYTNIQLIRDYYHQLIEKPLFVKDGKEWKSNGIFYELGLNITILIFSIFQGRRPEVDIMLLELDSSYYRHLNWLFEAIDKFVELNNQSHSRIDLIRELTFAVSNIQRRLDNIMENRDDDYNNFLLQGDLIQFNGSNELQNSSEDPSDTELFLDICHNIGCILTKFEYPTTTCNVDEAKNQNNADYENKKSEILLDCYFDKLFQTTNIIDCAFLQVLNGISDGFQSRNHVQMKDSPKLMEFMNLLVNKLRNSIEVERQVPSRLVCGLLNVISLHLMSYVEQSGDLLSLLIESQLYLDIIWQLISMTSLSRPSSNLPQNKIANLVTSDKWLVILGDGDNNMIKVFRLFLWTNVQFIAMAIIKCYFKLSTTVTLKFHEFLMRLIDKFSMNIDCASDINNVGINSIDLLQLLNLSKSMLIQLCSDQYFVLSGDYLKLFGKITSNVDFAKKNPSLIFDNDVLARAIDCFFICFRNILEYQRCDVSSPTSVNINIEEIFDQYLSLHSKLFCNLMVLSPRLETQQLLKSIETRTIIKSLKYQYDSKSEDEHLLEWENMNCNFDNERVFNCELLTSDTISVNRNKMTDYLAVSRETIDSGVWSVTLQINCGEGSAEFYYGLLGRHSCSSHGNSCGGSVGADSHCTSQWSKDREKLNFMSQVKEGFSFINDNLIHCTIDVDQGSAVFFCNNKETHKDITFGSEFKLFISASNKYLSNLNDFSVQILSIRKYHNILEIKHNLKHYEITSESAEVSPNPVGGLSQTIGLPHQDLLMILLDNYSQISCAGQFNSLFIQFIIQRLIQFIPFCENFDKFNDWNLITKDKCELIFLLHLLQKPPQFRHASYNHYRGQLIKYKQYDRDDNLLNIHSGIIVGFSDRKWRNKPLKYLAGMSFATEQHLINFNDVICSVFSFSHQQLIHVPINQILIEDKSPLDQPNLLDWILDQNNGSLDQIYLILNSIERCLSKKFYDLTVPNQIQTEWFFEDDMSSDLEKQYLMTKCFLNQIYIGILSHWKLLSSFKQSYLENRSKTTDKYDILQLNLVRHYRQVIEYSACGQPMRKIDCVDRELINSIVVLYHTYLLMTNEIQSDLPKRYAQLYFGSNGVTNLNSNSIHNKTIHPLHISEIKKMLTESMQKLYNGQESIDNIFRESVNPQDILMQNPAINSNNATITFNQRRRNHISDHDMVPLVTFEPQNEYDSSTSQLTTSNEMIRNIQSHETWTLHSFKNNFKKKKSNTCPICGIENSSELFDHLSKVHSHNCEKEFQHKASFYISASGDVCSFEAADVVASFDSSTNHEQNSDQPVIYCATIKQNQYAVCDDFINFKRSSANNDGKEFNPFIDWSGTSVTEHFHYIDVDSTAVLQPVSLPIQESVKVLGENIDTNVYTSGKSLKQSSQQMKFTKWIESINSVCLHSSKHVKKAFKRLDFSILVLQSRSLLIELMKLIHKSNSKQEADQILKDLFGNDHQLIERLIRLVEHGRFDELYNSDKALDKKDPSFNIKFDDEATSPIDGLYRIEFMKADLLALLIQNCQLTLTNHKQITEFLNLWINRLSHLSVSDELYFGLDHSSDASCFSCPSFMTVELFTKLIIDIFNKALYADSINYIAELERIVNILSYVALSNERPIKLRIWSVKLLGICLDLSNRKWPDNVGKLRADIFNELGLPEIQYVEFSNSENNVKLMDSINDGSTLLTADSEGAIRTWDIPNRSNELNDGSNAIGLWQTFLFSTEQHKSNSFIASSPNTIHNNVLEQCLDVPELLAEDISSHLIQNGVQRMTANNDYVVEALGLVINIWSRQSQFTKPYIDYMPSLVTVVEFAESQHPGLHNVKVDNLLVAMADGQVLVIQLFDHLSRITKHFVRLPTLNETKSPITAASWPIENYPIAIGYHNGSIVLAAANDSQINISANENCLPLVLAQVHTHRVLFLQYNREKSNNSSVMQHNDYSSNMFLSCGADESQVYIWQGDRPLCAISIDSAPTNTLQVTWVQWCPQQLLFDPASCRVVVCGDSSGNIQFIRFNKLGTGIKTMTQLFGGHLHPIIQTRIHPCPSLLASGCLSGRVCVWSLRDETCLLTTTHNNGPISGLQWIHQTPATLSLAIGWARSGAVRVYNGIFTDDVMSKTGLRQWARLRLLCGKSDRAHSHHYRMFSMNLAANISLSYEAEQERVMSGKCLTYSTWLQTLVHLCCNLPHLINTFIPLQFMYYADQPANLSRYSSQCSSNISTSNQSYITLQNSIASYLPHIGQFLLDNYRFCLLTQHLANKIPLNNIDLPFDWWIQMCFPHQKIERDLFTSNNGNQLWTNEMQQELIKWFTDKPHDWLLYNSNQSPDSTIVWGSNDNGQLGQHNQSTSSTAVQWFAPMSFQRDSNNQPSSSTTSSSVTSDLKIIAYQIVCGTGVTLAIPFAEGRNNDASLCSSTLVGAGRGLTIVFNPYMRERLSHVVNIPVLSDLKITYIAVSKGSETHLIAITLYGDVYSWGHGLYGKLGHGYETTLKKPKIIEAFMGKEAIQASCGHDHSAVVTFNGDLYTFGLGTSGQLGITMDIDKHRGLPSLVVINLNNNTKEKIGMVSCSINHTLALSQCGTRLYAFGNGDYGKLGLNNTYQYNLPQLVKLPNDKLKISKILCGNYISCALDTNGKLLVWGCHKYTGLFDESSNTTQDVLLPTYLEYMLDTAGSIVNSSSQPKTLPISQLIDVDIGNDACLVLSYTGTVYGWGSNSDNRLLLGANIDFSYRPQLVKIGKPIPWKQVSCGPRHSSLSICDPVVYTRGYLQPQPTPLSSICSSTSPIELDYSDHYPNLFQRLSTTINTDNPSNNNCSSTIDRRQLTARLLLILYWNQLLRLTMKFWLPFCPADILSNVNYDWPITDATNQIYPMLSYPGNLVDSSTVLIQSCSVLRQLIDTNLLSTIFQRHNLTSMNNNATSYSKIVEIDRVNSTQSVFTQTFNTIKNVDPVLMRLPWRAWKVKLLNEGADDAGGAYDETISQMITELQDLESANPPMDPRILIPLPGEQYGTQFILNPDPRIGSDQFYFLGLVLGAAQRTIKPIGLRLAPLVWMGLSNQQLTETDLRNIDRAYITSMSHLEKDITQSSNQESITWARETYGLLNFCCHSINGKLVETVFGGHSRFIDSKSSVIEYTRTSIRYRLKELYRVLSHVRSGMRCIVPLPLIDLMNWDFLERVICGTPYISVDLLKRISRYTDKMTEQSILIQWLWQILETFTEAEKCLFLRFVTGKTRLPSESHQVPFRLFIRISKEPVTNLPQAQTCFNQLRLPNYSTKQQLESRLRLAISQCRCIDMDDYMLIFNEPAEININNNNEIMFLGFE